MKNEYTANPLTEHLLTTMADADLALAHATVKLDAPHTLDAVTQDWVNATIGGKVTGAELLKMSADDAHDGMTSRKKWLLEWNAVGQASGLPNAIFVKATPSTPEHIEMLAALHMHETEAKFYAQLRPEISRLAPESFYAERYAGGRFLILLEDLELRGCKPYWLADDCSLEHAKAVAVTLAQLHATYWQSDRLQKDLVWVRPRTQRFGWPWLRDMSTQMREAFLNTATAEQLCPNARRLLTKWNANANAVYCYLDTLPQTVLHGDSHLGNTYSNPDGTAGLFDWQVMFSGHGLRDLSYFVHTALSNENRIAYQTEIFELYLATLAQGGVTLDKDEAWDIYCIFTLDFWDANIITRLQGEFGHANDALKRNNDCVINSVLDNDVEARLDALLEKIT